MPYCSCELHQQNRAEWRERWRQMWLLIARWQRDG